MVLRDRSTEKVTPRYFADDTLSSIVSCTGNTLEGDVSDVIALDQLTSPFSPRKATKMSP